MLFRANREGRRKFPCPRAFSWPRPLTVMSLETCAAADLVAAFRAFKNNLVGFAHTALWAQLPVWSGLFHSRRDLLIHILYGWRENYSVPLY